MYEQLHGNFFLMIPKSTIPLVAQMTVLLYSRMLILCVNGVINGYHFKTFLSANTSVLGCCTSHRQYYFYSNGLHIRFLQTITKKIWALL